MRRLFFSALVCLFCGVLGAEEIPYCTLQPKNYDDFLKTLMDADSWINCDSDTGDAYWYVKDFTCVAIYRLDPLRRKKLVQALDKFAELSAKTAPRKSEARKGIETMKFDTVDFKYGDFWNESNKTAVEASFVSQPPESHYLVFSFHEIQSKSHGDIQHSFKQFYFDRAEAVKFKNALLDFNINKCISLHKQGK